MEGTAISHTEGSDEIRINKSGTYQISYQLQGRKGVGGTFNFEAFISVNNNALQDTFNESPIIRDTAINRLTLTSTVILKLEAGDILRLASLSIEDISYDEARIDIEKII